MTSARSWPKAIGFSIPALLLWGLTALFLWAGLANTWYGWISQDWPVAEGRILRTDVEEMRSSTQETTGMLSRGEIGASHCGHLEGGRRTDSPEGTRTITTFRNEPTASPKRASSGSRSALLRA